jgi:hypothetical protein
MGELKNKLSLQDVISHTREIAKEICLNAMVPIEKRDIQKELNEGIRFGIRCESETSIFKEIRIALCGIVRKEEADKAAGEAGVLGLLNSVSHEGYERVLTTAANSLLEKDYHYFHEKEY